MSKKKKIKRHTQRTPRSAERPGQAPPTAVSARQVAEGWKIDIDASKLNPPDHSFSANYLAVQPSGDSVEVVFGQVADGRMFRAVVVAMSNGQVAATLQSDFVERLNDYADANNLGAAPLPRVDLPDSRVAFERASIARVAHVGPDAELRFYSISANDYQDLTRGADVDPVYPVVEILLSTENLLRMVRAFEQLGVI